MQNERSEFEPSKDGAPKGKLEEIRSGKVDFRVALTPRIETTDKVRKAFAAAVARHERARAQFHYFSELSRYSDAVGTELIHPAETEYSEWVEKEIRLLDAWSDQCPHKLTKKRRERLLEILVERLVHAIHALGRTDLEAILERHQEPMSAAEKAQREKSDQSFIEDLLGTNSDREEDGDESGPGSATSAEGAFGPAGKTTAGPRFTSRRAKTKRQLAKEAEQQKAQELLDRDIKRVFKDLVVKLHPDLEQDAVVRQEKEELMKLLTRARDENDYLEMLRLHVLVNDSRGSASGSLISEGTLKTLVRLLNQKTGEWLQRAAGIRRTDFLMARVFDFSRQVEEDRFRIREAATEHATAVMEEIARLRSRLDRITRDAEAFYQFLKARQERNPSPEEILAAMLADNRYF